MKTQQCIHFVGDIKVAPAPTVYQMESRNSGHEMRVNGGVSWPRSAQTANTHKIIVMIVKFAPRVKKKMSKLNENLVVILG